MEFGGIEQPPKDWRGVGLPMGVDVKTFKTQQEVTQACAARGQTAYDPYGHGNYNAACYDGRGSVLIIDPKQVTKPYWNELMDHEAAHPWGLVHDPKTGRGWSEVPGTIADHMRLSRESALNFTANPPKAQDYARVLRGMTDGR